MAYRLDPAGAEIRALQSVVDLTGKDVLEVGAGWGRLTWRFADRAASVLAIDPRDVDVERAQQEMPEHLRPTVTFLAADVATHDLPDGSFDAVLLSWSIC